MILAPVPVLRAPVPTMVQEIAAPSGWSRETVPDERVRFFRKDTPAGKRLVILLEPEEDASGDLGAWLARTARRLGLPKGEPRIADGIAMMGIRYEKRPMIVAAVRPKGSGDRAWFVTFTAEPELLDTHSGAFTSVLESLAARPPEAEVRAGAERAANAKRMAVFTVSDRTKPLPVASDGGVKAYSRFDQEATMDGLRYVWRPLLLFPDGSAFDDVPREPIPSLTPEALRAAVDPTDAGRWKVEGATMTLTWPAREAGDRTTTLRKVGEGWARDPKATAASPRGVYRRVGQLTPKALEGQWEASAYLSTHAHGQPLLFGGFSVATWSGRLAFEGDRYTDRKEGFSYTLGVSEERSLKRVSGRYRIDGVALTREFPDGAGGFRRGIVVGYLIPTMPGDDSKVPFLAGRVWVPAKE